MKYTVSALLAAVLLCAPVSGAKAETYASGFNPRFGVSPANPDNPDYRPPDRPRHDFSVGIELFGDDDRWRPRHRDRRDRRFRPRDGLHHGRSSTRD